MTASSVQLFLQILRRQIAEGDIQSALDQLHNFLSAGAPSLRNEATVHTARYNRLCREERKGIITRETFQVELNRLSQNILDFLNEIPRAINKEMAPVQAPDKMVEGVKIPENAGLEIILGSNNLKQIAWLEKGTRVARSVCRILTPEGLGTGFLIAPNLLMTNNHVIQDQNVAAESTIEFDYQLDFNSNAPETSRYKLDLSRFHSNSDLDYTIVGVMPEANKPPLESWGFLHLNANTDPVPGEHVIIIQHPNGGPKQITLTANQVVGVWEHRLHYTTDTMPGSSGSPVFNDLWQVIAIHHAGGELQINAKGEKRFVNEGILMSAIRPDAGKLWPA